MDAALGFGRQMAPRMMDRGFDGPLAGHGVFFSIGLLLVAAVVLALIVWAVARKPATAGGTGAMTAQVATVMPVAPSAAASALDIARTRLARGEINVEQYKAIAEVLGG